MIETIENMFSKDPKNNQWYGRCINLKSFNRLKKLIFVSLII